MPAGRFVRQSPTVGSATHPISTTDKNFSGWNNGFFLQSPDRSCQLRITGQIQADYRGFLDPVDSSSTANSAVAGSPTTGSPDTFLVRRARLGIEATMANYYEFRLLPDFAGSTVAKSITDAYMNVHYWDAFQFEIGKFKQPFSYEDLIQDRYVPTMERSMMDQLCPQRDEGAMIHGEKLFDGRFDYAAAVSNGDPNDSSIDDNNDKDFNARVVVRPFYDVDGAEILNGWRIGISGSFGVENDTVSTTSSTPPTITTPATVTWFAYNSGVIANGVRHRISPELVYFYRSLGFASQYYYQDEKLQGLVHEADRGRAHRRLLLHDDLSPHGRAANRIQPADRTIASLRPCRADWRRQGPGNWCSAWNGWKSATRRSSGATPLASNTGTTNRSSNEAMEETTGVNWYLTKWARRNSTGNMPTSQPPFRSGT